MLAGAAFTVQAAQLFAEIAMTEDVGYFEQLAEAERLFSDRAGPILARIAQQVEAACGVSIGSVQVTFQPADPAAARGDDPTCVVVISEAKPGDRPAPGGGAELHMLAQNSRLFRRQGIAPEADAVP